MNNLITVKLKDIGPVKMCKRILKSQTHSEGDVPFYKIKTFGGKPDVYISNELFERYSTAYSFPKNGSILISAAGTLGKVVKYNGERAYFQDSNIVWIDNDESILLNDYLYYFYLTKPWQVTLGSTIPRLYNKDIENIAITFPKDLEKQRKIVAVLKYLDSKIANNNVISKELETMAKTIYDYWFLQYEFPDKDGKPYKSNGGKMVWNDQLKRETPEGWKVGTLDQLFQITMGTSPKGDTLNQDANGIEFYQGSTDFGKFYPKTRVYTTKPIKMVKSRDVLLSVRAPVGAMNLSQNDCCIGRGLAGIHYDISPIFAWNKLKSMQNYFDIFNNNGTTFGSLTSEMLNKLVVIIPDINVIKLYAKKVNIIEQQMRGNHSENQQLKALRDFLLPMLMNGQIEIND